MSANTNIEWADHTFNPWIGCTAISQEGCVNCYAKKWVERFGGDFSARRRTKNWGDPERWNKQHAAFFANHGRRQRVFCASLADVFDNEVDPSWRRDLIRLISDTPNLDWLLLTKRIGNVMPMMRSIIDIADPLPGNVWLGATVVNQEEADRDIPKLLDVPAAKRFLSMEPLLGPVDMHSLWSKQVLGHGLGQPLPIGMYSKLHWVIVGGESGPKARPMHPDWARSLRDQCQAAGVPLLFKQWGEWTPGENVERVRGTVDTAFLCSDGWRIYPLNLATHGDHVDDQPDLYRVGKKAAGRLLDGVTHDGFPP